MVSEPAILDDFGMADGVDRWRMELIKMFDRLMARFDGVKEKSKPIDPMMELMNLKQIGTVEEYFENFDNLLNLLEINDEEALDIFTRNLKEDISRLVRFFCPNSLTHALKLAKQIESLFYDLPREPSTPCKNLDTSSTIELVTKLPEKQSLSPFSLPDAVKPSMAVNTNPFPLSSLKEIDMKLEKFDGDKLKKENDDVSDWEAAHLCHLKPQVHHHLGQGSVGMVIVDKEPINMIGTVLEPCKDYKIDELIDEKVVGQVDVCLLFEKAYTMGCVIKNELIVVYEPLRFRLLIMNRRQFNDIVLVHRRILNSNGITASVVAKKAAKNITDIQLAKVSELSKEEKAEEFSTKKQREARNDKLQKSVLDKFEKASGHSFLGQGLKFFDNSMENLASGAWQALESAWTGGTNLVQKLEHFVANIAHSTQHKRLPAGSIALSLIGTGIGGSHDEMKNLHDSSINKITNMVAGITGALAELVVNDIIQRSTGKLELLYTEFAHMLSTMCYMDEHQPLMLGNSVISSAHTIQNASAAIIGICWGRYNVDLDELPFGQLIKFEPELLVDGPHDIKKGDGLIDHILTAYYQILNDHHIMLVTLFAMKNKVDNCLGEATYSGLQIAMFRKSILMLQTTMTFAIVAFVLGKYQSLKQNNMDYLGC